MLVALLSCMRTAPAQNDCGCFAGRYISLWSVIDIIVVGDKIVAARLDWKPFEAASELEYVNDTTLKVSKTSGYGSEGELIHSNFNAAGAAQSVLYCGATLLPEEAWHQQQAGIGMIGTIIPENRTIPRP